MNVRGTPSGLLAGMRFDQLLLVIEADGRAIGARGQGMANQVSRERVERLGDLGMLIARYFRRTPARNVIRVRRCRQEVGSFHRLEVLAWKSLRPRVSAQSILFSRPMQSMVASLSEVPDRLSS